MVRVTIGTKKSEEKTVELWEIKGGGACILNGSTYIKLDRNNIGVGIDVNRPKGYSVLFNPKYGSIRALTCRQKVYPCIADADFTKVTRGEAKASDLLREGKGPIKSKSRWI